MQDQHRVGVFARNGKLGSFDIQAMRISLEFMKDKMSPDDYKAANDTFEKITLTEVEFDKVVYQPLTELYSGELWKSDEKMAEALTTKLIEAFDSKRTDILAIFLQDMLKKMEVSKVDALVKKLSPESPFRKMVENMIPAAIKLMLSKWEVAIQADPAKDTEAWKAFFGAASQVAEENKENGGWE